MTHSLFEMTKDEWWDVVRKMRPDWTRERYEAVWAEFQALKARKQLH